MKTLLVCILFTWPYLNCLAFNFGNTNNGGNQGSIVIDGKVMEGNTIINNSSSGLIYGNGKIRNEQRKLNSFKQLIIKIPADIKIIPAQHYSLKIKGDDNIIKLITSKVNDQQLVISSNKSYSTQTALSLVLEVPALYEISQLASGDVFFESVKQDSLKIKLVGDGTIFAAGQVKVLDINITGSGDIQLEQLSAENAQINIDGMGNANIHVTNELYVSITGMGDVVYSGKPNKVHKNIVGMGSVEAE